MKITKTELAKIVKEETEAYLSEMGDGEYDGGSIYQNERYVDDIKNLLGDALQNDTENVRKALEALQNEIGDQNRGPFREGSLAPVREYQTDKAVPPGTNALEVLQVMGNDLIKYAAELAEMPSDMPAADASGFINARGQELLDVHAEMTSGMVPTE